MSKPLLLLYDPAAAPWVPKVNQLCAIQGLRLRPAEPGETCRTLHDLAFGGQAAPAPGEPLPEPLLVLCGFSAPQLDKLLAGLRKAGVPRECLKAVLTPHNAGWSLAQLYRELCLERAQMQTHAPDTEAGGDFYEAADHRL